MAHTDTDPAASGSPFGARRAEGSGLLVGRDIEATRELGVALGLSIVAPPELSGAGGDGWDWTWRDALGEWGCELGSGAPATEVVVCTWSLPGPFRPLVGMEHREWQQDVEVPLATWFTAVRAVAGRCRDGGSIVVVAERPAALDSVGRAAVTAVSEGLATLTRSVARAHGHRRVRANLVATELFTAPDRLDGTQPPLASFPGSAGTEVAGAVRLLWSDDAAGVTGTVLRADCGRSW